MITVSTISTQILYYLSRCSHTAFPAKSCYILLTTTPCFTFLSPSVIISLALMISDSTRLSKRFQWTKFCLLISTLNLYVLMLLF